MSICHPDPDRTDTDVIVTRRALPPPDPVVLYMRRHWILVVQVGLDIHVHRALMLRAKSKRWREALDIVGSRAVEVSRRWFFDPQYMGMEYEEIIFRLPAA